MQVTLQVTLLQVGRKWLAVVPPDQMGGFKVRSEPSTTATGAFKNLLWKLSGNGPQDGDAELGVDMLMQGTSLQKELERQALPPAGSTSQARGAGVSDEAAEWMRAHPDQSFQDYLDKVQQEAEEAAQRARDWSEDSF